MPLILNQSSKDTVGIQFDGCGHFEQLQFKKNEFALLLPNIHIPDAIYEEIAAIKAHCAVIINQPKKVRSTSPTRACAAETQSLVPALPSLFAATDYKVKGKRNNKVSTIDMVEDIFLHISSLLSTVDIISLLSVNKASYEQIKNPSNNYWYVPIMARQSLSIATTPLPILKAMLIPNQAITSLQDFKVLYQQEYISTEVGKLKQAILHYDVDAVKIHLEACYQWYLSLDQDHPEFILQLQLPQLCYLKSKSGIAQSHLLLLLEQIKFSNGLSLISQVRLMYQQAKLRENKLSQPSDYASNCLRILNYFYQRILAEIPTNDAMTPSEKVLLITLYTENIFKHSSYEALFTHFHAEFKVSQDKKGIYLHPIVMAACGGDFTCLISYCKTLIKIMPHIRAQEFQNQTQLIELEKNKFWKPLFCALLESFKTNQSRSSTYLLQLCKKYFPTLIILQDYVTARLTNTLFASIQSLNVQQNLINNFLKQRIITINSLKAYPFKNYLNQDLQVNLPLLYPALLAHKYKLFSWLLEDPQLNVKQHF